MEQYSALMKKKVVNFSPCMFLIFIYLELSNISTLNNTEEEDRGRAEGEERLLCNHFLPIIHKNDFIGCNNPHY